ncbi:MAG: glycosyltransferase [Cyanobacteria bacterium P01_H01_bin.74]
MNQYKSQTLSVVVVTLNNQDSLANCLASAKWADEIIVLDAGSSDNTLKIARHHKATVVYTPFKSSQQQQQEAVALASCHWILLLEPTDVVDEMLRHEIDGILLNTPDHIDGFTVQRELRFMGKAMPILLGNASKHALRLVKNSPVKNAAGLSSPIEAAEKCTTGNTIGKLDRKIISSPYNTLDQLFEAALSFSTRQAFDYLRKKGLPKKPPGWFTLMKKTKAVSWRNFICKGMAFKGTPFLAVAMADILIEYLTWVKVRALFPQKQN